jgi:hypothetical protein
VWLKWYSTALQVQSPEFIPQSLPTKKHRKKKSWGMAQVVKHLPSKYKALNSTSNTAKKRRGKLSKLIL